MWEKKVVYVLNYLKTFKAVQKTIHGYTYSNKREKLCWQQLPTTKSLPP